MKTMSNIKMLPLVTKEAHDRLLLKIAIIFSMCVLYVLLEKSSCQVDDNHSYNFKAQLHGTGSRRKLSSYKLVFCYQWACFLF